MRRRRPTGAPAGPAGADGQCIYGCGTWVRAFLHPTGQVVQLEDTEVRPDVDVSDEDIVHRLYAFYGTNLGWVATTERPRLTWRPLRVQHDCDRTPWDHKPRRSNPIPVRRPPASDLLHTTTTGRNRN